MTAKASVLSKPIRIVIVDDHPVVRRGLAGLVSDEPDLEVCGEAADAPEALRCVDELDPDLLIVDISLKNGHGIELMKRVRARNDRVRMLVSSMHDESLYAERALRAGAMGYVNKQEPPERLIEAVRHVMAGNVYLSPHLTERMLRRVVDTGEPLPPQPVEDLSNRELEVFELIGRGMTTRDIAARLHLSVKTIESYRENIKSKLNLKNAAELACQAAQWLLENR